MTIILTKKKLEKLSQANDITAIMRKYTVVIKLGTSSLCDEVTHEPKLANMSQIVETVVRLRRQGVRVIIVSSGGIAVGLRRVGEPQRPKHMSKVQAIAAIGQARLIGTWDELFQQFNQPIAQVLLTRNDIADRTQYLNAANTMNAVLDMGAIPIVNENDTLSIHEIRFGDNDTLSAITAAMVNADYLFLLTDVDCLYTDNPRNNPNAKPVLVVDNIQALRVDVSSAGSKVGTGGMTTKLIAAELATSAGITTIICRSSVPGNIPTILEFLGNHEIPDGHDSEKNMHGITEKLQDMELKSMKAADVPLHTRFVPKVRPIKDRKFWILHGLNSQGTIYIDTGAYTAITRSRRAGLLPVGVIGVEGNFHTSECVDIKVGVKDKDGKIDSSKDTLHIGRCLVNYESTEIDKIKGLHSHDIDRVLGYADSEYIAFRDNIAFHQGKRVNEEPAEVEKIMNSQNISEDALPM